MWFLGSTTKSIRVFSYPEIRSEVTIGPVAAPVHEESRRFLINTASGQTSVVEGVPILALLFGA
jgi:hypothetical protein